jgi:hypothetical protein
MSEPSPEPPSYVVLFRVVKNNPATVYDCMSREALGMQPRHPTAKALRLWSGLSMNRTREQAVQLATASPWLGEYVAEFRILLDSSIRYELDNGRNGHCTVWGDPRELLALIVSVTRR